MDTRYDLIFEGRIADGCSPQDARRNLAKLLRQEPDQVEVLFSGKPYVLRRALDPEAAYRYQGAMKHAGLVCRLVPSNEIAAVVKPSTPATTAGVISLDKKPASSQTASVSLDKKPANPALALDPLPSESAPASNPPSTKPLAAPAAFTECPKCHYRARSSRDGLMVQGVCPACGLIIAKYLERQAELNRPKTHRVAAAPVVPGAQGAEPHQNALYFDELPPGPLKLIALEFNLPPDITLPAQVKRAPTASLKRRFLAAVATYFSIGFLMAVLILLGMILLLLMLNLALSMADNLNDMMRTVKNFEDYEIMIRIILWLLGLWLGFIYLPMKWDGLTYGQRLMRIAPVSKNNDEVIFPDTGTLFQRLAGNIIAFLIWPVTLLWLMFSRSGRSIADRLSDCRQIEVGAVPDSPVLKALSPIAYGILLGLVAVAPLFWLTKCAESTVQEIATGKKSFGERMLGEPLDSRKVQETLASRAAQKEEFGSPKIILERLVEFQRQYHAHHRCYSDAIEELVMESSDRQSPMMLAMLMRQQMKIQLIGGGFKIGLHRDDGWHIATEEGYQGVQPSF